MRCTDTRECRHRSGPGHPGMPLSKPPGARSSAQRRFPAPPPRVAPSFRRCLSSPGRATPSWSPASTGWPVHCRPRRHRQHAREEGCGAQGHGTAHRHGDSGREGVPGMLGVFAEFETNLRRERQLEGIAKAKAAGKYQGKGRPATISGAKVTELAAQGHGAVSYCQTTRHLEDVGAPGSKP